MKDKMFSIVLMLTLLAGFMAGCAPTPSGSGGGSAHVELTPLSAEELAYFNGDEFFNGEYLNIRNQFLSSLYEAPEQIDLFQLFYCGSGVNEIPTEEEKDAVVAYNGWDMQPDCACQKISRANMEAVLAEYMGLTLADTEQIGLENFTYLEEYDAYYYFHGDTNYRMSVTFSHGMRETTIGEGSENKEIQINELHLTYDDQFMGDGKKTLTLREQDGVFLFVSNRKVEGNV